MVDRDSGVDTWTAMLGHDRAFLKMPVAGNRLYCYADLTTNARGAPRNAMSADFGRRDSLPLFREP